MMTMNSIVDCEFVRMNILTMIISIAMNMMIVIMIVMIMIMLIHIHNDRTPSNAEDPKNAMSFVQPGNLSRETKLKVQAMKMLARWLLAIKGMSGARQSGMETCTCRHCHLFDP